jgi:hypothetical protein
MDELSQRVAKLEARVDAIEDLLNRMDGETRRCQETQQRNWDALSARIDKMLNNELVHVDARIAKLESKKGVITGKDWAYIIGAIVTAAGVVLVAIITVLGGS